jgi:hypothetical protein
VGLRNWAKRLERESRGDLDSFELLDGSRYYFPAGGEVYMHCWRCFEAGYPDNWPEPPEVLSKVLEARDPSEALQSIWTPAVGDIFPYDREALVNERKLVPRSLVEGEDPYERSPADLSE